MAVRPIIFRAKRKDNGEWVEGSLIIAKNFCCILQDEEKVHPFDYPYLGKESGCIDGYATPVIPETVGQYTGLTDKHGNKIFEGDIVKTKYGRLCIVVWFSSPAHNGWDLLPVNTVENCISTKCPDAYDLYREENLEVIGNIHDNKLEVEND